MSLKYQGGVWRQPPRAPRKRECVCAREREKERSRERASEREREGEREREREREREKDTHTHTHRELETRAESADSLLERREAGLAHLLVPQHVPASFIVKLY